jgi:hypothetical protein
MEMYFAQHIAASHAAAQLFKALTGAGLALVFIALVRLYTVNKSCN